MSGLIRKYIAGEGWQTVVDDGGGGDSGTSLPQAVPDAGAIDSSTYDNPFDPGNPLTVLVMDGFNFGFGIAIDGDAFPRMLFTAEGIYLGDGTYDPYNNFHAGVFASSVRAGGYSGPFGQSITMEPDGTLFVSAEQGAFQGASLNMGDANLVNRPKGTVTVGAPLQVNGNSGPAISGGAGEPGIGAEVGDLFIRTDPPDVNHYLYRCTVAGADGFATWVAVGGLA